MAKYYDSLWPEIIWLIGNLRDVGARRVVENPQVLAIRRRAPTDGNPPRLIGNFRDVGARRVVENPQGLAIRRRAPTFGFTRPYGKISQK